MRRRVAVLFIAALSAGVLAISAVAEAGASVGSAKAKVCAGKTKKKAIKDITTAFDHFLDGAKYPDAATDKAPFMQYLSEPNLSQSLLDAFVASSSANAEQASTTDVAVNEVTCTGKKTADVAFDLVIAGEPLAGLAPPGSAVLEGKRWKVTGETLCNTTALGDPTVLEPPHPCADIVLGDPPSDVA